MVLFNHATKEVTAKLVYYGPGLCGKTTNLQWVHENVIFKSKGKMLSLATEADRTLFFDFLPVELGTIRGHRTRVQIYTVPGQVFYDATRKMVLKGADAVVFVADSQEAMLDANAESLESLRRNLIANDLDPNLPMVIQYNKRDLPTALPGSALNARLNTRNVPYFEAVAVKGVGVEETLKGITKLLFTALSDFYGTEAAPKAPVPEGKAAPPRAEPAAPRPTPAPAKPAPPPAAAAPPVAAPAPPPAKPVAAAKPASSAPVAPTRPAPALPAAPRAAPTAPAAGKPAPAAPPAAAPAPKPAPEVVDLEVPDLEAAMANFEEPKPKPAPPRPAAAPAPQAAAPAPVPPVAAPPPPKAPPVAAPAVVAEPPGPPRRRSDDTPAASAASVSSPAAASVAVAEPAGLKRRRADDAPPPNGEGVGADQWIYLFDNRQRGPLDLDDLIDLVLTSLKEDTRVWRPGLRDWTPANMVPEIAEQIPPPLPFTGIDEEDFPDFDTVPQVMRTVLIADEDDGFRTRLALPLAAKDFRIFEASSGAEAWRLATEHRPWLMLSDIDLPEIDGFEFCSRVRNNSLLSHNLFVFISRSDKVKDRALAQKVGSSDFLSKQTDLRELLIRIQLLLAARSSALSSPGAEAGAGAGAALGLLEGQIEVFGAPGVLQICNQSRLTGIFTARAKDPDGSAEKVAVFGFRDGEIINATVEDQAGVQAVYAFLAWQQGQFKFVPGAPGEGEPLAQSVEHLLLEGCRLLDETSRGPGEEIGPA
jgi:CheY-like chemotaxis protein/signal recognition particle receptor subunit beta